jgi:hypothetical protein
MQNLQDCDTFKYCENCNGRGDEVIIIKLGPVVLLAPMEVSKPKHKAIVFRSRSSL